MTALAAALGDRDTCRALEADFRQYYGLSLKGIWTGELCWFEAARLLSQLPRDSRTYRNVSSDPLSFDQHLQMSILDALRVGAYYTMAGARAGFGNDKRAWASVIKRAPKPLERPGTPAPEKKRVTVPAKHAKAAVSRMIQSKIARRMMG
jgi:hypothetical protein